MRFRNKARKCRDEPFIVGFCPNGGARKIKLRRLSAPTARTNEVAQCLERCHPGIINEHVKAGAQEIEVIASSLESGLFNAD